jgi:hypothetical protein
MGLGLDRIWFHDSEIHRVVENPESDELGFEVMYPVDWYQDQFAPRTIVFKQVLNYTVAEGPFAGKPTILDVCEVGEREGRVSVRIDTNAGVRTLLCTGVEIRDGWTVV